MPERIQKLLARQGLGSRRQIEELIRDGVIKVNGDIARIGDKASVEDTICIRGQPISLLTEIQPAALVCNKPCGFLVTRNDNRGRRTVFSLFPEPKAGRWISVGRLDINTSGLLIVCNVGELANRLMHPSYQIEREYQVRVSGRADYQVLENLHRGVMLDKRLAKFKLVELHKSEGVNSWYRVVLCEGRNREVRRLWQSQGFIVDRLERVRFGPIRLDVPSGDWRSLRPEELQYLYKSVNLT